MRSMLLRPLATFLLASAWLAACGAHTDKSPLVSVGKVRLLREWCPDCSSMTGSITRRC